MFAVIIFISCNIDSLLLLMMLFCTPAFPVKSIVVAQFQSQSILIFTSVALARLAWHVSPAYIGLMGVVPITLGACNLFARYKFRGGEPLSQSDGAPDKIPNHTVGEITVLGLSNGGDNLSVYVPVFTARPLSAVFFMSIVFLVMTGIWCAIARYLAHHQWIGQPVSRYSQTLLPWNMIALGIYVLSGSIRHLL